MDATTATAKRKRSATDIAGGDATTATAAAAGFEEVSDAEVDEFYAILRRMRDASRRLCGAGVRPPACAPAWRPSFSWEDFAPAPPQTPPAPAPAPARPDERAAEDTASATTTVTTTPPRAGLDLNAEPEPDAPAAPATPRSARVPA